MPETKTIRRPSVVHQYKVGDGKIVTTKCGLTGPKKEIATSAWHSETTCERCNP